MDKAFFFYYQDNLRLLEAAGARLVPFSPLDDRALPAGLDGLYIGGGYPEAWAAALAANAGMRESIRAFAGTGAPVYAECGGLMYLARALVTAAGERFPMVGLLPATAVMLPKLRTLGYVEVTLRCDSLLGPAGAVLRGHEFHYSELKERAPDPGGWTPAYEPRGRSGQAYDGGFCRGNVLASYIHIHFGSRPEAASALVARLKTAHRETETR